MLPVGSGRWRGAARGGGDGRRGQCGKRGPDGGPGAGHRTSGGPEPAKEKLEVQAASRRRRWSRAHSRRGQSRAAPPPPSRTGGWRWRRERPLEALMEPARRRREGLARPWATPRRGTRRARRAACGVRRAAAARA
eukprot:3568320-Prymnesium_polylepis.1